MILYSFFLAISRSYRPTSSAVRCYSLIRLLYVEKHLSPNYSTIMFQPDSHNAPNIALITLVCGWLFTALAILAVILLWWARRLRQFSFWRDYHLLLGALSVSIALVVHTSWAIVEEGLGRRQRDLSTRQRASLIKVSHHYSIQCETLRGKPIVNHGKRDTMDASQYSSAINSRFRSS